MARPPITRARKRVALLTPVCLNWSGFRAEMPELTGVFLPVLSVERLNGNPLRHRIQASNVDIVAVWIRSWDIECLDSTDAAKMMLCDTGIECVGGKSLVAANKLEC